MSEEITTIQVSSDHSYLVGQIVTITFNGKTEDYVVRNDRRTSIGLDVPEHEPKKQKPYYKRWEGRWRQ